MDWIKKEEHKVSELLNPSDPPPVAATDPSTESPVTGSTETPSPLQPEASDGGLTAEQQTAKDNLIAAAQKLGEATEAAHNAGLDVLAELQGTGLGGGPLPPAGQLAGPGDPAASALGHVPEGQLPPV
jgi:hypothetical protein